MSKNPEIEKNHLLRQNLDEIMSDRFARYSKYIIQERALPDVRDGLKPVQRRILYSMHDLGLQNNKPYKKSARIVGDVIGKYHPHGDKSIYEAMVRMAQPWKMAYPLVDMHGNIGSMDDDPSAAMRYTETRLAKISHMMLAGIEKGICPFVPNFDDSEKEPSVLPAQLPNLLMNGAKGIAAGFATEMPPHNLGELLKGATTIINNPHATIKKIMKNVKGPDFPYGGIIYGTKGINDAFSKGRGKLILASKWKLVEDKKMNSIVISEIPYGVVKSKLIFEIADLVYRQNLNLVLDVLDMSDRNGIEIVIKIKKDANADDLMAYFFSKTSLQITYNYNNIVIKEGYPILASLSDLLNSYVDHLKEVKRAIIQYDLQKAEHRLEIVLGFLKVANITSAVIETIRKTQGGKSAVIENLVITYQFTKLQATAIAEMQLYRLSQTDFQAFVIEKGKLEASIEEFQALLNDENIFKKYLIKFLKEMQQYALPRKTEIIEEKLKTVTKVRNILEHEDVKISLTKEGYLKRSDLKSFAKNTLETFKYKENDQLLYLETLNTNSQLVILTSRGNFSLMPIYKLETAKWQDLGEHLSKYFRFEDGEEIINAFKIDEYDEALQIAFVTQKGLGKRIKIDDIQGRSPFRLFRGIKLKDDDALVSVFLCSEDRNLLVFTNQDLVAKLSINELPQLTTAGMGNKIIKLSKGEVVTYALAAKNKNTLTLISQRNYLMNLQVKKLNFTLRTNKGRKFYETKNLKNVHLVKKAIVWNNENNLILWLANNEVKNILLSDLAKKLKEKEFSRFTNGIQNIIKYNDASYTFNEHDVELAKSTSEKEVAKEDILEKSSKPLKRKVSEEKKSKNGQESLFSSSTSRHDSKKAKKNSNMSLEEIDKLLQSEEKTYNFNKSKNTNGKSKKLK